MARNGPSAAAASGSIPIPAPGSTPCCSRRAASCRASSGPACAGIPLGIWIGWSALAARSIDPLIQGLRPIPITAWLPFSIALFGIRDMGAVFLIALGAFYPILVNATHGARDVGRNLIRAAQMMGAVRPRPRAARRVSQRAAGHLHRHAAGLGVAWTAVIVAEIVAVKSGLGYVLWDAYYVGRMDVVLADMVSIGLAGFLSDRLMLLVQARVLHWRTLSRG